jgi:acyl dehydratase
MDDPDPLDWLKSLGVNLLHILHGQQRFDYRAPVFAGDRLSFDARIADIYEKKNGALQFIVKHTEVRNQDDASVATLASTVVYRDPSARTA